MDHAFSAPELSIPLITGLGLLDAINPCVIGVLILLLTVLLKSGKKNAVLRNGIAYTAGVYITYLVGGLTLLGVFNAIRAIIIVSQFLYIGIGIFILIAAVLEIKDYFWYGRWFSLAIPARLVKTVESRAAGAHTSLLAAFSFGAILTLIELPCTGAPYLAILTLMSQSGLSYITGLPLLIYYNLIFILPLIIIIYMAYSGFGLKRIEGWRKENRGTMRLFIGLALFAVGIWIITAVTEHLLVPLIVAGLIIIGLMWFAKSVLKI
jgi:cytochrome c biogenesis protein CcdA